MSGNNVLRFTSDLGLMYYCPGCMKRHMVYVDKTKQPSWTWNGDMKKPTFSPSVLVKHTPIYTVTELEKMGDNKLPKNIICHAYIRDGEVQYLSDSNHHLSGKTVPMVKI